MEAQLWSPGPWRNNLLEIENKSKVQTPALQNLLCAHCPAPIVRCSNLWILEDATREGI